MFINGSYYVRYITGCNYFVYKGVKYGKGTVFRFTHEFCCKHEGRSPTDIYTQPSNPKTLLSLAHENGKIVWKIRNGGWQGEIRYDDIVPDRDIYCILEPVYYYVPKELAKQRWHDGTWVNYIWKQTLFYVLCLLVSPIFKEWYLVWTIGLYAYLRICYIILSNPAGRFE